MVDNPSRPTLESDLAHAQQAGDAAQEARLLFALADIAADNDELELAQGLGGQAWEAYQRAGDAQGEASAILMLMNLVTRLSQNNERETLFMAERLETLALHLYEQIGDLDKQAAIWLKRGRDMVNGTTPREVPVMIAAFEKAMALYLKLGDTQGQADIFAAFGTLEMMTNSHERARPLFEKALVLYGEDNTSRSKALALYQLGKMAASRSKPAEALRYLKTAQELYEKTPMRGDDTLFASRYEEIGELSYQVGEHAEARKYLEDVLRVYDADSAQQSWKIHSVIRVVQKLAPITQALRDYEAADGYFQRAHTFFLESKNFSNQIKILQQWAKSKAEAGDLVTSRQYYGEALALNTVHLDATKSPAILWEWGQSEYQAGEHQRGYDYCRQALQDLTAHHRDEDKLTLRLWVQKLTAMKIS